MKVNWDDLPPEAKKRLGKRLGRKVSREMVLRVAATILKAAVETGESIETQKKALELVLRWLKAR